MPTHPDEALLCAVAQSLDEENLAKTILEETRNIEAFVWQTALGNFNGSLPEHPHEACASSAFCYLYTERKTRSAPTYFTLTISPGAPKREWWQIYTTVRGYITDAFEIYEDDRGLEREVRSVLFYVKRPRI